MKRIAVLLVARRRAIDEAIDANDAKFVTERKN